MTDLVILADPRLALLSSVTPTLLFGVMVTSASVRSPPLSVTPSDGRNVPLSKYTPSTVGRLISDRRICQPVPRGG